MGLAAIAAYCLSFASRRKNVAIRVALRQPAAKVAHNAELTTQLLGNDCSRPAICQPCRGASEPLGALGECARRELSRDCKAGEALFGGAWSSSDGPYGVGTTESSGVIAPLAASASATPTVSTTAPAGATSVAAPALSEPDLAAAPTSLTSAASSIPAAVPGRW